VTRTRHKAIASWDQTARRNGMLTFYDVRREREASEVKRSWNPFGGGLALPALRGFHSHFT
jgi:hypothetical protein